jgi:Na+-translocating ferredoxin:NAD+ oxidoreductase RNF subunit RnfB|tara:strand:- start:15326 stop:17023 length:1698 start_codon:yes stop_codon:yes gene_type:complete
MQEFIYYNPNGLEFPVSDEILVTTDLNEVQNKSFLISNTNLINSELTAKEVDFYIKNSKDNLSKKIENVSKLYEIAATKYDFAQDISYDQEISKDILLITNNKEDHDNFVTKTLDEDFNLFYIKEDILKSISGHIGNLSVIVDDEGKDVTLNVSQIVWFEAKEEGLKQSGTFDPKKSSLEDIINTLRNNITSYSYKKFTTYDKNICQYHERREEICSKCEEVCPTVAIVKDDKTKTLEFSQIDCHGCGGCISVCPSGALDYAPSNKESIYELSKFFKNKYPLILPAKMELDNLDVPLKEDVLPFAIEGEKFLHEETLLTLLQMSGSQVVFYTDFISKGTGDSIRILNDIYQKKYAKDAIIVAANEEELINALEEVSFVEGSYFNFNQDELKKREIFSHRLQKIVGEDNLGVVKTGEHVHYGLVKVNESNCTLCLVCVGACNVDALQADATDNTLRLNPSLCTSCGYCEVSCPEVDCLTIERDVIHLEPTWFKENILAKDTLFACVECGKEFATTKSIEKIAGIMGPIFSSDPVKERSLYCCADCKPKIMMQSYFDKKNEGQNDAR